MELELVKLVSFDEYNERLYYEKLHDETLEQSRRKFLKYLVVGSTGLLVPTYYTKEAEANPLILAFQILSVAWMGLKVINEAYTLAKNAGYGCSINIKNEENKSIRAPLNCYAHSTTKGKNVYSLNKKSDPIEKYTFAKYVINELPEIDKKGKYTLGIKSITNPDNNIKNIVIVV